jgi:hypothetical protein
MKLFREIVTNKIGNILALINLFVIALKFATILFNTGFLSFIFSLFFIFNFPANTVATLVANCIFQLPQNSEITTNFLSIVQLTFFISVYFQWTIIGYLIGKIRGK